MRFAAAFVPTGIPAALASRNRNNSTAVAC